MYRAVLANSADPIALLDHDGVIRFVSASIKRLTGFAAADLIGRHAFLRVHPDDERRVHDAFLRALANPGLTLAVEYRARHIDGSWRDREVVGVNRLQDPDIRAIVVNYRDTTARHQAEMALAETERLHKSTFDQAPIGIAHTSVSGSFLRVNRCFCQLLAYTAEELKGTDFMSITHPDDVEQDVEAVRRLISAEADLHTREKRYRRKDGTFVLVNVTVSVHRNGQGRPAFFIAVAEDLTERKRLEQELRQAHKLEAIGRLAGGIAHDFNNLLTAIAGYADLAIEQLSDAAESPVRRDVEEIRSACRSAASLTRQLLAFSRRQVLQTQIVDLNAVMQRMHGLLGRLIGENIDIVWRLATPLDRVNVDPGQIEQVVLNLALNARDAMPEGGTITVETGNVFVDARPHVSLAIRDTGMGIDDSVRDHLFEPFYTSKEPGHGTGLGLATVYGIVKQSGGSISVDTTLGQGTAFTVHLPSATRVQERNIESVSTPGSLHGAETILLVEDQHEVRSVTREVLTRHGYSVIEASDATEAIDAATGHPQIHLLLADVVLPGTSGPALAKALRGDRPDMRVLFMSGYTADFVEQGALTPDTPLIQKPFSPEGLLGRLREVLDM